jgi:hypothetical protein
MSKHQKCHARRVPTSLRLPTFRSSFRVTHRFTRPLNHDFGDVFAGAARRKPRLIRD